MLLIVHHVMVENILNLNMDLKCVLIVLLGNTLVNNLPLAQFVLPIISTTLGHWSEVL